MSWKRSLTSAALVLAALAPWHGASPAPSPDGAVNDFTLQSPDGPVSLRDLRGKVVLVVRDS